MNKIFSVFLLLVCLIVITSCNNIPLDDESSTNNPSYIVDENAQIDYIEGIGKTIKNVQLIYKVEQLNQTSYIKYSFDDKKSVKKVVYNFYKTLDEFHNSIRIHEDNLDGIYNEVNESILLVCTVFESIDAVEYDQIYEKVLSTYTIIA